MADKEAQFADSSSAEAQSQEMQMQFLDALDALEEGQLVEGTVIQISGDEVFVDIGYKAEGRIPMEEFETVPDVGGTVEVVLLRKDIRNGGVAVSKRKADEKRFWKDLKQAFEERIPVSGKVVRSIKGGFEVRLQGNVRGFNPISKIDIRRVDDPEEYVGVEDNFFVERIYSDNRVNIVLSRRAWLEQETEKNRNHFFETVTIGDEVEGVVKSFTSFGAFIDLGGFDGLLHINDMSWGHVTRPKDYVKKGDSIRLKVIKMDPDERKINLSLRHMTPDPWETFEDRYWVDQVVSGNVTKLTDFGAFIELEEGIEGLVHISEMSWVQRINHPKEILQPGQEVETKILDYDIQSGRVSLGLKQVLANPWDDIDARYPEGMRITSVVKKITATGAFLELEPGIDAFLHVDDLSWTKRYKNPGAAIQEGQELEVVVILSDPENQNIRVGLKQLEDDPWNQLREAFPPRSIIDGEITNITEFGIFVRVQGGVEGLINKMNVADPRQLSYEEAAENYKVGDSVRCVVTEVNPSRQRLSLSIRELHRQEQRQELEKYIHDDDENATVTLGDMLKEKKDN
ncbi:small subunit ribosomal protein S1 [Alkalispirochaeta americana]|uniref:30S ribosomal protein S1 n=1 Tax=Alkalispirochaeta americana TaxID=159291 RepID=A0A1N6P6N1_9SPIO|nr:30S ribosomal protein S1 [Alkalispirochaeta americana]SIQ00044.1 small subunit ribosomal protein S1 [Alkalispirochaeta americana]